MPINEYEGMKKQIEQLKKESVHQFVKREYTSLTENKYTLTVNKDKLLGFIQEDEPEEQITFRPVSASLYERPTVPMTCISCGHREFAKFTTIHNCPQCKGLVVDNYYRGIIEKVLENAGYVLAKDMNVNDVLSMTMKEIGKAMNKESLLGNATVR